MEYNNNNCTIYYAKNVDAPNREHPHFIQEQFYCLNLT